MKEWLDKRNKMERLNFNATGKIKEGLEGAKGYYPISLEELKTDNKRLYEQIMTII